MQVRVLDSALAIDTAHVAESPAEIRRQVRAYLDRERREFDLTVEPVEGFVGEVMETMCSIPYGETRTYGQLAETLETAPVAVGGACGRNPVPLVVPCHRVVGADGIGGYSAGSGPALKRALLRLEDGALDGQRELTAFD